MIASIAAVGSPSRKRATSPPAQKARPSPRSSRARAVPSCATRAIASRRLRAICGSIALSTRGRLSVMTATDCSIVSSTGLPAWSMTFPLSPQSFAAAVSLSLYSIFLSLLVSKAKAGGVRYAQLRTAGIVETERPDRTG
ncbi:hypothetical protein BOS5A_150021 [Bosea sp. EC-HK365B]|nr:hypothetical protein BOSE7B_41202 [Bosea sp. 7B]VVT56429.1 hypothetical protein BOS5A_150021 [Bosea sp. EC-HK365B]VXC91018.1 hypothetical protein BOSE127_70245 [Bosea sp. 127]